jgi:hypothetical protein
MRQYVVGYLGSLLTQLDDGEYVNHRLSVATPNGVVELVKETNRVQPFIGRHAAVI